MTQTLHAPTFHNGTSSELVNSSPQGHFAPETLATVIEDHAFTFLSQARQSLRDSDLGTVSSRMTESLSHDIASAEAMLAAPQAYDTLYETESYDADAPLSKLYASMLKAKDLSALLTTMSDSSRDETRLALLDMQVSYFPQWTIFAHATAINESTESLQTAYYLLSKQPARLRLLDEESALTLPKRDLMCAQMARDRVDMESLLHGAIAPGEEAWGAQEKLTSADYAQEGDVVHGTKMNAFAQSVRTYQQVLHALTAVARPFIQNKPLDDWERSVQEFAWNNPTFVEQAMRTMAPRSQVPSPMPSPVLRRTRRAGSRRGSACTTGSQG